MRGQIMTVIGGVLTIVFGLVLSTVVLNQATTAGGDTQIGSFSGAQAINDLIPFVYFAVILLIGVGMIGIGGAGLAGRGPMASR